jgi:hypothetical protein
MDEIILLDVFYVVHIPKVGKHFGVEFVEGDFPVPETG